MKNKPALIFLTLFVSGIIFSNYFYLNVYFSLGLTLITLLLGLLLKNKHYISYLTLYTSVILIGFSLSHINNCQYEKQLNPLYENENVTVFGSISSTPTLKSNKLVVLIDVDSIFRNKYYDYTNRTILANIYLDNLDTIKHKLYAGKKIYLHATIEQFPFGKNPGEFDYGKFLKLNYINGIVSAKGLKNISADNVQQISSIKIFISDIQSYLYKIIDSLHDSENASFLKGIIFGYRADLSDEVKQSFIDTGTIHILAVSGSNVAFVAFVFYTLFGFFRLPKKIITILAIIGLFFYMLITGSSPSVVRAVIMATVILIGNILERKASIYNSISVAALILLFWDTNNLYDIGFQLSFSAVIAIVYLYPKLENLIIKIPSPYNHSVIVFFLKVFAVSLAAQIGTIPFTAYYFNRISLISFIANIIVVPLSGLNTIIGAIEILTYMISTNLSILYAATNDLLSWFLLEFVKHAANVPYAFIEIWNFSTIHIILYCVSILILFNLHNKIILKYGIISFLIIANILIFINVFSYSKYLKLSAIDVGQGDAILIEFPNGNNVLIDSGPSFTKSDAGTKTIIPFLKRKDISKINYFVLTHPHQDHIGGAISIINSFNIDTIVIDSSLSHNKYFKNMINTILSKQINIKMLHSGNFLFPDSNARSYVFHPTINGQKEKSLNDYSIVIKIIYGKSSVLLMGDAEAKTENTLLKKYGNFLQSNIIKIGHHGSKTSSQENFIATVNPQKAIISVGAKNKFKHPDRATINTLQKNKIEISRTDIDGAIIFNTDGNNWQRYIWR